MQKMEKETTMTSMHAYQLVAGPHIAGFALHQNDRRHLLVIKDRIIPLTRTEYALTMILLHRVEQVQHASLGGRMNFFVSISELLQVVPISKETLRQHIRNARTKLAPYGISLASVGGYGYTVVFCDPGEQDEALACT